MRAGPKAAPGGPPLDLGSLPERGGDRVIGFVHEFCKLPKGNRANPAGRAIRLRPWQQEIVCGLFDPDPRPRQGLVSISRKNGKSLLGAALSLYCLLADAEESAECLIVSSDEGTARVIFNLARRMVELEPRLDGILQVFQNRIYHPSSDSTLEVLPGSYKLLMGRNPTFAVVDECHVVPSDVWDAMSLAGGTRTQPLVLGISTETGVDDDLMARLVSYGRAGGDPAFFFREWTAPPDCDIHDRGAWKLANPALGDFLAEDHLAALVKTTREPAFRRYHLNQRVGLDGQWLPVGAWAACKVPDSILTVARSRWPSMALSMRIARCWSPARWTPNGRISRLPDSGSPRTDSPSTSWLWSPRSGLPASAGMCARWPRIRFGGRGLCRSWPTKVCPSPSTRRVRSGWGRRRAGSMRLSPPARFPMMGTQGWPSICRMRSFGSTVAGADCRNRVTSTGGAGSILPSPPQWRTTVRVTTRRTAG
jgi:hypothetical protein